jgi:hypothetical protein
MKTKSRLISQAAFPVQSKALAEGVATNRTLVVLFQSRFSRASLGEEFLANT